MSDTTKKVSLRWEVDNTGAVTGALNKIGDAGKTAADNVNKLRDQLTKTAASSSAGGGGAGNFLGSSAARDQLILDAMRNKNYQKSGLTPAALTQMSDQQLFDLKKGMGVAAQPSGTSLYARALAMAKSGGASLADSMGVSSMGKAGGPAAVVTALLAANEGINSAGVVAHQGGTAGEQARAYANSNFVTRNALGLVDSVRGRDSAFAKADYDAKIEATRREGEDRVRQEQNQMRLQKLQYDAQAAALNGDRRYAAPGQFNRSTVAGERAYHEDAAMLGSRQEIIDRQKDLTGLSNLKAGQEQARQSLLQQQAQLQREANDARAGSQRSGGVERSRFMDRESQASSSLVNVQEQLKQLALALADTTKNIVVAKSQIAQAALGAMQSRLGVLEGREGQAAGNAQRLGRMNRVEYAAAQRAALMVEQFGVDNVPPQVAEMAERFAPQQIGKKYEQRWNERQTADKDKNAPFAELDYNVTDVRKEIDDLKQLIPKVTEEVKRQTAQGLSVEVITDGLIKALAGLTKAQMAEKLGEVKRAAEQANTLGTR